MLRTARNLLLRLLKASGGFELVASSGWRQRRLLILCYHGFALRDEHLWNPALFVTAEHLRQRLQLLAQRGFLVLPLGEAVARLQAGELPPRSVAITVDDGLYDFLARAYPVLEEAGVPATVYVSTYNVVDQRPVFTVMASYLFWRGVQNGVGSFLHSRQGVRLPLPTPEAATAATQRVHQLASGEAWSADDKHRFLEELAGSVKEDWEGLLRDRVLGLMTPDEIRGLDPAVASIQLHTHRHRVPRDRALFLRELEDNRRVLAECGLDPAGLVHFCYPSGVHFPEFLPWLRAAGIVSATTCRPALAQATDDPLVLPRWIDANSTPAEEFEAWVVGVRHLVRRRVPAFTEPLHEPGRSIGNAGP